MVPNAPTSLHQLRGPCPIRLAWADNSDNEDGFRVYRSVDGGAFAALPDLPANTTTFTDTGSSGGHHYSYYVVAFNADGESSPSNTISNVACLPSAP
jgi:hypothetical protein